jgi:hypothetical protein
MMSSKELQTLEKCNKIKIEKIINIPLRCTTGKITLKK